MFALPRIIRPALTASQPVKFTVVYSAIRQRSGIKDGPERLVALQMRERQTHWGQGPSIMTNTTILLVEDELLIRMVAADTLVSAGYRVLEAADADQALLLLSARPDVRVIVTDVRMPGRFDGIELAHLASKQVPSLGIVVVSGHALPQAGDLPPGAVFLPKPYYPSQLEAAVASFSVAAPANVISVEDAVIAPSDAVATGDVLAPNETSERAAPNGTLTRSE